MSPHNRSHLGVLLAFMGAAVLVTWPLVIHMNAGVPYGGDAFQFIWNGWWFGKASCNPNLSIWMTPYQYAPIGASLLLHDLSPLNAFMQSNLSVLTSDFAAYNILILFHYILGAWGAYILAWYLTGNRAGSVIAGVIYGFSTFHAMHLPQLSTVSSGWLPLSIYYLLKYTRNAGWRDGVLSVLMLLAAAMSHWYHLVFTGVIFLGLITIGQSGLKEHRAGNKEWFRAVTPWLIVIAALSPIILDAWDEADSPEIQKRTELGASLHLDPAWLVLPPPDHPVFGAISRPYQGTLPGNEKITGRMFEGSRTEGIVSLGLIAIILGFLAWFRKNPTTRTWCWLGLILFLFALGRNLTFFGMETPVPGPFRIWEIIPGLNLVRVPARFIGPFTLSLGIAAAGFIAGLGYEWLTGRKRKFLLWALPILILLETIIIPIPISGSEYCHPAMDRLTEIYAEATGDNNPPDMVINFPIIPQEPAYFIHQTMHEIPSIDGNLSNPPEGSLDYLYLFNWDSDHVKSTGIDMVLYHPWAVDPGIEELYGMSAVELIEGVFGYRVIYEDDRLIVFIP